MSIIMHRVGNKCVLLCIFEWLSSFSYLVFQLHVQTFHKGMLCDIVC